MAIPHLHRPIRVSVRLLGFAAAAIWVGVGCTSYPSPPAEPVYETDVRPIFLAHCTRCHGAGPDGGMRNNAAGTLDTGALPPVGCFTQYGVRKIPDGGTLPDGGCVTGANPEAPMIKMYTHTIGGSEQMPPPPAAGLNSYEQGVIDNWVDEGDSRKCSDAPQPPTDLYCPDAAAP